MDWGGVFGIPMGAVGGSYGVWGGFGGPTGDLGGVYGLGGGVFQVFMGAFGDPIGCGPWGVYGVWVCGSYELGEVLWVLIGDSWGSYRVGGH